MNLVTPVTLDDHNVSFRGQIIVPTKSVDLANPLSGEDSIAEAMDVIMTELHDIYDAIVFCTLTARNEVNSMHNIEISMFVPGATRGDAVDRAETEFVKRLDGKFPICHSDDGTILYEINIQEVLVEVEIGDEDQ